MSKIAVKWLADLKREAEGRLWYFLDLNRL
jgi:hypothetical protein